MTTFHIISLFPETIEAYLSSSILGRAQKKGSVAIKFYNPRDFSSAKKGKKQSYADRRVDDRPYGGGPGMVIEALPIIRAIDKAVGKKLKSKSQKSKVKVIFFSPAGKQFSNTVADSFKKYADIVLICGRYEGIDARVKKVFPMLDISVG